MKRDVIRGKEVSFARDVANVIYGVRCAHVTGPRLKMNRVTMRNCTTVAIPTGKIGPREVAEEKPAVP